MKRNRLARVFSFTLVISLAGFVSAPAEQFPDKELYEQAGKDWNSCKWNAAYEKLTRLVRERPGSPYAGKAYLNIALHLKNKKLYREAIEANLKVIDGFPGSYDAAEAYSRIGCIYNLIGDGETALKYFLEALSRAQDWQQEKYANTWAKWLYLNRAGFAERQCGPKSLARVLEDLGRTATLDEINFRIGNKKEVSLFDLARVAEEFGVVCRGVKMRPERIRREDLPVLIHVPPYHFSVITGMTKNKITVFDSVTGNVDYDRKELGRIWSGEGLVFHDRPAGRKTARITEERLKEVKGSYCTCCPDPIDDDCEEESIYPIGGDGRNHPRAYVKMHSRNIWLKNIPISYNPGIGLPMDFAMSYSQDNQTSSPAGNGWFHTFGTYVVKSSSTQTNVVRPAGYEDVFNLVDGNWIPDKTGVEDVLAVEENSVTLETFPGRVKYYYDCTGSVTGKVTAIEDVWGKKIKLYYDGGINNPSKIKIVDAVGTDASGAGFEALIDNYNRITKVTEPQGRSAYFYYNGSGDLTKIIDMNTRETVMTYEGNAHNLNSVILPGGGADEWHFLLGCNVSGVRFLTKIVDPLGNETRFYNIGIGEGNKVIDANGHTVRYQWNSGVWSSASLNNTTKIYRYLNDDDYYSIDRYYDDSNRCLTREVDQNGNATLYAYGTRGLLTRKTDALNNVTDYYYDTSTYDLTKMIYKNNVTGYYYGSHHEITRQVYPDDTEEKFCFDSTTGKITKHTDRRGNSASYEYSGRGYLTRVTDPENNSTVFLRDSYGRLTKVTDAKNQSTTYAYDNADRVTRVSHPDANTTDYFYDCCEPTKIKDANGKEKTYYYDKLNRLLTAVDAEGNATIYSYDGVGNLTKMTDADGCETVYAYDVLNRLTRTTYADGGYETYVYDATGNLTRKTDPGGEAVEYLYDAIYRLTETNYL